jgi:hypothetical protein
MHNERGLSVRVGRTAFRGAVSYTTATAILRPEKSMKNQQNHEKTTALLGAR